MQSNSQLSTDRNTCNALNLKAQPSPPAVPIRQSSESNRTAQHIVHTSFRPQTVSHSRPVQLEAPFSQLCDHHHLQAHGIPPTISEPSPLCAPASANSACFSAPPTATSITLPRTARLSHLSKHIPRSHSRVSPHIQAISPFCLTMPQAPRLLVWFLTLPSQIARAALRRIGGKPPCPLAICSLVRFTETKQRRLLATKSNQKRRN